MDRGIITLQRQNRHNDEHIVRSVDCSVLKNVSCVAHFVVSTVVLYLPLQHAQWLFASITPTYGDKTQSPFSGRLHPRQLQWLSSLNWPSPHKTPLCLETIKKQQQKKSGTDLVKEQFGPITSLPSQSKKLWSSWRSTVNFWTKRWKM